MKDISNMIKTGTETSSSDRNTKKLPATISWNKIISSRLIISISFIYFSLAIIHRIPEIEKIRKLDTRQQTFLLLNHSRPDVAPLIDTIADAVASDFAFVAPMSSTYHSRPIMMTWLLLFFSSAVKAQHRNGTQNDDYGIYTNLDPTLAVVIVALICALFFLSVFTIFIRHFSEPAVSSNLIAISAARRQIGLDPAVIEKFPMFFYYEVKDVKIGRETLECAICLSEFEDQETLRLLPICDHVFHPGCIDEWLASRVTCPVCRAVLAADSGETPKDPPPAVNRGDFPANLSESRNEVAITVNDDDEQNREWRRPRLSSSGRFLRSHSTGHSLVHGGEKIERYTLRLSEEARMQIMANAKLKRALSVNEVSTKEWSVRKGYRIGGEGSRQLGWSMLINPVFVSRGSGFRFGFS